MSRDGALIHLFVVGGVEQSAAIACPFHALCAREQPPARQQLACRPGDGRGRAAGEQLLLAGWHVLPEDVMCHVQAHIPHGVCNGHATEMLWGSSGSGRAWTAPMITTHTCGNPR